MFVQDFIHIERPLATTVDVFEHPVAPHLAELVREAWDLPVAGYPGGDHAGGHRGVEAADIDVRITARRPRPDGFVFTISWPPCWHPWFPEFDADIEFAWLSPERTHVQLAGQARFPALERWSVEERRASRNCMVAVDRLLANVAATIENFAGRSSAGARST